MESATSELGLRERRKQILRQKLENATIRMVKKHGFSAVTVDKIARAAGTTRTTFYQYFNGKSDLIEVIQKRVIAPEMIMICEQLDALTIPSRKQLRLWMNEYARSWQRIHVFFAAYSEASALDPSIARSIIIHTDQVTAHMTRLLSCFPDSERKQVQSKLDILLNMLAEIMLRVHAQNEAADESPLLDHVADIFWDALFIHARAEPA